MLKRTVRSRNGGHEARRRSSAKEKHERRQSRSKAAATVVVIWLTSVRVEDALAASAFDHLASDFPAPDKAPPKLSKNTSPLAELIQDVLGLGRPRFYQGEDERVDADTWCCKQPAKMGRRGEQIKVRDNLRREGRPRSNELGCVLAVRFGLAGVGSRQSRTGR